MATKTTRRKQTAKRKNFDPISVAAGLSAMQSAKQLGLHKVAAKAWKGNPEDIDFLNEAAPYASLGHVEFTPDGIERYVRDGYVYMAFSNTPVFPDGYRMGTPEAELGQFTQANPAKYERCVKAVQQRGGANGYAVCAAKGLRNPRRRNPEDEANAVYEDFHGTPPTETLVYRETLHFHGHLGGLADLVHVVVKLIGGKSAGKEIQLNAPDPEKSDERDIVKLTANEARNQLYFTGGDQSLDLSALGFRDSFDIKHDGEAFEATEIKDSMVIGLIYRIMYRTEKEFDNFETIDYHHEAGEDTGLMPFLTYDTLNDKMGVAGGSYVIHARGIVN